MVVGHTNVGENAECNHYHRDLPSKHLRLIARLDRGRTGRAAGVEKPLLFFVDINVGEGAVGIRTQINTLVCSTRCDYQRGLGRGIVQLFRRAPRLHVWVSLNQEEVAKEDAGQEESSTDEIRKKVRKCSKDASRREDGRYGD